MSRATIRRLRAKRLAKRDLRPKRLRSSTPPIHETEARRRKVCNITTEAPPKAEGVAAYDSEDLNDLGIGDDDSLQPS